MKKLIFILVIASGLILQQTFAFDLFNNHTIKGNGTINTVLRTPAESFHSIDAEGPITVVVLKTNRPTIRITADKNLMSYIMTIVQNRRLIIKPKQGFDLDSSQAITVTVTSPDLLDFSRSGSGNSAINGDFVMRNITMHGSGDLAAENITSPIMKIAHNGSGNLAIQGKTLNITQIEQHGSGNTNISGIHARGDFVVNNDGNGNITLAGDAINWVANDTGTSNIDASQLKTDVAQLDIKGTGNINVDAEKALDSHIYGSGNVGYTTHNPNLKVEQEVYGSGNITRTQ